ncbi:hypothetical protein EON83_29200 [bacterium]|nr:MAG: hypothetical protein EON83_29200 [bacterium]
MPLVFEGTPEGWALLQGEPRFLADFYEYMAHRDFPEAYPWHKQTRRWQRVMLIISGIYRTHELMFKTMRAAGSSCPFAGGAH